MSMANSRLPPSKVNVVVLLATFVVAGDAYRADACRCAPVRPAPCEAAWQADAIFIGEVERVDVNGRSGRIPQFLRSRLVTFRVSEHFRGPGGTSIRVITGAGGGDCGYRFHKGQEYLVYATEDRDGQLRTSVCTRTRPLGQAREDLAYLRSAFQRHESLGQIDGTIFRRSIDPIRDRTRDRPAAGATIVLNADSQPFRAVAGDNGRFRLRDLPVGRYRIAVEVQATEYFVVEPEVVALADARACATLNAYVLPDGRVSGRVLDASRRPVSGLTIELGVHFRIDGPFAHGTVRAVSASDGSFELARVPPGEYVLGINFARDADGRLRRPRVFYPGREKVGDATMVKIAAGERKRVADFVLPPALRYVPITGVVLDADGSPVADARVFLKGETFVEGEPVVTDADGRFSIAALAGGEYAVFAERSVDGSAIRVESSDPVAVSVTGSAPLPITLSVRRRH